MASRRRQCAGDPRPTQSETESRERARTPGGLHDPFLGISDHLLNRHMTLVGTTGAGKTELIKRLTAGWTETRWRRYGVQQPSPLSGSAGDVER